MLNYRYGINNKQLITGFNENIALNEHLLLSLIVCGKCLGGLYARKWAVAVGRSFLNEFC